MPCIRQRLIAALALAIAMAALSGCAFFGGPSPPSGRIPATQRPYTVKGTTYRPLASAHGYAEEGVASWYGPGFHGQPTSCGEIYDQYRLTAAHKLLPMHTMVKVENLENGKSCVVRVNDRGPFVAGRIIDMSLAGARELGMEGKGTARVRVTAVGDIPGAGKGGELPGPFYVQVGAFVRKENAEQLSERMKAAGYAGTRIHYKEVEGTGFWRVHAGTFPDLAVAGEALARLGKAFPGAFILAE